MFIKVSSALFAHMQQLDKSETATSLWEACDKAWEHGTPLFQEQERQDAKAVPGFEIRNNTSINSKGLFKHSTTTRLASLNT